MLPQLLAVLLLLPSIVTGQERIALGNYNRHDAWIHYREDAVTAQAARFDLPAPVAVSAITITLSGDIGTGARVRLLGAELGASAPIAERELIAPVVVRKKRRGIERVTVNIPHPVSLEEHQCFVVVDRLSRGTWLLSDRTPAPPWCTAGTARYSRQLLERRDGTWEWGQFTFVVELAVTPAPLPSAPGFTDATGTSHLGDSAAFNTGIAAADIDRDGFPDLLAGGRLYRNNGDATFRDLTSTLPAFAAPGLQLFIDIDNDRAADILLLEPDGAGGTATAYVNGGGGAFTARPFVMDGLSRPTCFAVADVDRDGFPDVFIGQQGGTGNSSLIGALYHNLHGEGFALDSTMLVPLRAAGDGVVAAQWVDVDGNARPALYAVTADGREMLWRPAIEAQGPTAFGALPPREASTAGMRPAGCSWNDADGDGRMDLLLPLAVLPAEVRRADAEGSVAHFARAERDARMPAVNAPAAVNRSGGAWADVDNDGLQDFILTASCGCGYVELFRQSSPRSFAPASWQCGLRNVSAGPDALWVDVDNDGRVDLVTMHDGRPALYRNEIPAAANHFLELDLAAPNEHESPIGARVTVYSGDVHQTRELSSGRGLGMGDMARLHFGLGTAGSVDSVVVRWPYADRTTTYTGLEIDRVQSLGAESIAHDEYAVAVAAAPNPFAERTRIRFTIARREHVRLEVVAPDGRLVRVLADEERAAGEYAADFIARDDHDLPLPQGTYLYRLVTPHGSTTGKLTLQR